MGRALRRWLGDEQGVASVEYAMLLAVVVVASIGAWVGLGERIRTTMVTATATISSPLD